MENYYSKIFTDVEPPKNLLQSIMANISLKKREQALRRHILIMLPILLTAFVMSSYFAFLLNESLSGSGLPNYISLIFTDTATVLENISMYISLIAESIPSFTFSVLLIGIFGLLKISQFLIKDLGLLNEINSHKHKQKYANT